MLTGAIMKANVGAYACRLTLALGGTSAKPIWPRYIPKCEYLDSLEPQGSGPGLTIKREHATSPP